ncbi:MAG: HAD family hydrolase [Chloroflexota bacterium]
MVQSGPKAGEAKAQPPFAVLWDLDGVLVDTSRYHFESWRRAMSECGKELSEKEFRATFGQRNLEILRRWLPGLSEPEMVRLSERKESYFRELLPERIPLMPGVERLVTELADAGVPQAVASSTPRSNLEEILPRLALPLTESVAAEDVSHGKPDPEVFLKAAEKLGVAADSCLVVEDAVAGVEAARRAGMACLGVAGNWPPEQLAGADEVVDSLEQIAVADMMRLVQQRRAAGGNRQ